MLLFGRVILVDDAPEVEDPVDAGELLGDGDSQLASLYSCR